MPAATTEASTAEELGADAIAAALEALSDTDLLRLKALARLRVRGLPGLEWTDLLNEAVVRALAGSRRWPAGVPLLSFLAGTMRSVADGHWRRLRLERQVVVATAADDPRAIAGQADDSAAADPERAAAASQMLSALDRLFATDAAALKVIAGLAAGLGPAEIRARTGLGETEYNSARKRMRRALLRQNLGDYPR